MKIKTLEKLQDTIDAEMGWRKRELTAIKYNIQEARKFAKDTALRAGVAMLYAHWEGAIKNIAYYYLSYVSGLKLPYSKLKPNFYAIWNILVLSGIRMLNFRPIVPVRCALP